MIRKTTNGDISDEEFEAILKPFIDDYDNWIKMCDELIGFYFKLVNVSFNNAIDIFKKAMLYLYADYIRYNLSFSVSLSHKYNIFVVE